MKKGILTVLGVLLAYIIAIIALSPTWRTRALGFARGEKFLRGMPMHYWLDAMKGENGNLNYEAILALEPEPEAIPAFTEELKDPIPFLRQLAALALSRFGPQAKEAVPALTEMLKDDDRSCREAAAEALRKIDPEAAARAGIK
ncbi:MAG: HEAT repeat domain-containing protein [Planctomycetia bacterium]|nr:HEAT repeat domain-containing protein [Planctomycetia bacterium]